MSETPRNAPCPCGSGRKFKRCCADALGNPAVTARKHDRVGARIQAWAFEHHRAEMQAALEEITAGHEDVVLGDVDLQLIASWMHNDRELPGGGTAAQRYAGRQDLHPDERDIAARIAAARFGLLRVLRVMPGRWIELHDLTRGDDLVQVISHDVSQSARPDAVLVGRLMDGPPAPTLWGPVGFLDREAGRDLAALLRTYGDSLGLREQPAGLAAAMHAASREITIMLAPALRHPSRRQQAA
ncbi:MAG: SEC-C domain-containing protein [Solirubrobacteraceae bacterium]